MTPRLTDLLDESRQLGFLGPGPIEVHLEHALAFATVLDRDPARALDLGAGGGLPGLVLAARAWPTTRWTFLDANVRRTAYLRRAVHALGIGDRVEVITERAEVVGHDPSHRAGYDLVVARSFASPAVTAECAAPFLRVGGQLVVSEPPGGGVDARWPLDGVAQVGFAPAEGRAVAVADSADEVHLAVLRLASATPERYPRRVGVPTKRPLF